jgi:hypothetical protein
LKSSKATVLNETADNEAMQRTRDKIRRCGSSRVASR